MTFRPMHDRILVRPRKTREKTAAELTIPDIADEQAQEGSVVGTGNGTRNDNGMTEPLDIKLGDRIVFGEGAGTEVKINGEALIILKECDVLGTMG